MIQQEWHRHGLRFVVLVLIQVLVLRQIHPGEGWLRHGEIFIYPLFLMKLPMRMHAALLILLGFIAGLCVDLFYDTPGVHAGAAVFSCFVRPLILRIFEPRSGYEPKQPLTRHQLGMGWYLRYTATFLFIHILMVQMLSLFTFYYFPEILWRTLLSWVLTMIVLFLQDIVLNPRT